jgi:hypothetical protein
MQFDLHWSFHFDFAIQWQNIANRLGRQGSVEFLESAASSPSGFAICCWPGAATFADPPYAYIFVFGNPGGKTCWKIVFSVT